VNGLVVGRSIEAVTRAAVAEVAAGFGCLKLKAAPDESRAALVERVGAVRDAVGPAVRLRLDANGGWTVEDAIDRLRAIAGLDLEYVEQPVPAGLGPTALARVRRGSTVPVAADESVADLEAARRLLDADAVDVLVVKPSRVGGPLAAARLARAAADRGVGTVISTLFETGVGIAAALQVALVVPDPARAHGLATADLLVDDLVTDLPSVRQGRLAAPAGPGLGVVLDEAALRRFHVD
jgi:L-alanine-DL-glutamate epimerase-like enolase superfamily enzyme